MMASIFKKRNQYTDTGGGIKTYYTPPKQTVKTVYNPPKPPVKEFYKAPPKKAPPKKAPAPKKVLPLPIKPFAPPKAPVPDHSGPTGFRFAAPDSPNLAMNAEWVKEHMADTPDPSKNRSLASNNPEFWRNRNTEIEMKTELEHKGRPAYFNNINDPIKWAEQYTDPVKALDYLDYQYQVNKKDMVAQMAEDNASPPIGIGYTFGDYLNWYQKPTYADADTLFGARFVNDRALELAGKEPTGNYWKDQYLDYEINKKDLSKAEQISLALEKASPVFQPITDEQGNVVAPAMLTPEEYMKGLTDNTIYDANLPGSEFNYGTTELVYENGQLIPAEIWYRKTDRLMGGNWRLPHFSDTAGYEYNPPPMTNLNQTGASNWLGLQNFVYLQKFINDNKVGVKSDGTIGLPNQGMAPGFVPGVDYQILPALDNGEGSGEGSGEGVAGPGYEDPGYGEWGYPNYGSGGGSSYAGYYGNPSSSGYYGRNSYGPNYWSNPSGQGYGSGGWSNNGSPNFWANPSSSNYVGNNGYGSNYQDNQYNQRKGQYFSQLARWVI